MITRFLALVATASLCAAAYAQYPDRPVRIIVPTAAGGGLDSMTRSLSPKLSVYLGQAVIVENRPGSSTAIGEEAVAKSSPDGYTLLIAGISLAINPQLRAKFLGRSTLGYDPQKAFAPISLLATSGNVLVVNPLLPAKTVRELIELSKSRTEPMFYGTPAIGSTVHIAAEMFNQAAGTKFQLVPYKGSALAHQDLMGGRIHMTFDNIPAVVGHIRSGKLRAIAVTTARRSAQLPDVPTIMESGLPGYQISAWFGLLAPAGTPAQIIARLSAETRKALASTDVKERFSNLGSETAGSSPEEFQRLIETESQRIGTVLRIAGVKPE